MCVFTLKLSKTVLLLAALIYNMDRKKKTGCKAEKMKTREALCSDVL